MQLISPEEGFEEVEEICFVCHGTGELDNFYYMQNCTMKEMAEVIAGFMNSRDRDDAWTDEENINEVMDWLKEKC